MLTADRRYNENAFVPAEKARAILHTNHRTLKALAQDGWVEGRWVGRPGGRKVFVATVAAWRKGLEAYRKAHGLRVPPGWISMGEAARRLGVGADTMQRVVRAKMVPIKVVRRGSVVTYYAAPDEWERGLRRLREANPAPKRRKKPKAVTMPAPAVSPEVARRRLAELTPIRR